MMKYRITLFIISSLWGIGLSAQSNNAIETAIQKFKTTYAPDKRTAIVSVSSENVDSCYILRGETNQIAGKRTFLDNLRQDGICFKDSIRLLPDTTLGKKTYGLVNLSVICMRSGPDYMDGLDTQTILGAPVRIMERQGWWRIQSADNYLGWTHYSSIIPVTKEELEKWNQASKIIITTIQTYGYSQPNIQSQTVSDLIAGNRLRLLGKKGRFYKAAYPDGREAWIPASDCMKEEAWLNSRKPDANHLIATAYRMMGFPYLWGGTSVKGMDCSGFVKTCAFLNGLILTRDASQMAYVGQRYTSMNYKDWKPGDLLFFGRAATQTKKEHVSHVALYMGNGRFIHCMGYVHTGSFNPEDPDYDEYDKNRFLWAVNVLDHIGTPGIQLIKSTPLYQAHITEN